MAKLDDETMERCAADIASAVKDDRGKEYLYYECAKMCTQAAVYMRAVEIVDGVDFGNVGDYVFTGEGPKEGDPVN